jgi:hypothetical protein
MVMQISSHENNGIVGTQLLYHFVVDLIQLYDESRVAGAAASTMMTRLPLKMPRAKLLQFEWRYCGTSS